MCGVDTAHTQIEAPWSLIELCGCGDEGGHVGDVGAPSEEQSSEGHRSLRTFSQIHYLSLISDIRRVVKSLLISIFFVPCLKRLCRQNSFSRLKLSIIQSGGISIKRRKMTCAI